MRLFCKISFFTIIIIALFTACDNSTDANQQKAKSYNRNNQVLVNNDEDILTKRVTEQNTKIIPGDGTRNLNSLTLIAQVSPPTVAGKSVQASYVLVDVNRAYAYVGYHTNGDDFGGGVEIMSLRNIYHPRVISQALFSDTDVQAMEIDPHGSSKFWMASALSPGAGSLNSPAMVEEIKLRGGKFPNNYSSYNRIFDLPGAVVKGVRKAGFWLYTCTSNTDGGTYCHSLNSWDYMRVVEHDKYNNAKGISIDGNNLHSDHLVLEAGLNANLHIYDVGSNDSSHEPILTNIGTAAPSTAKMMCDIKDNIAYVAMGTGGFKAFDISAGATTNNPTPLFYFPRPGNGLTNAVSVDDYYIYVANGQDGLYIFEKPSAPTSNQLLTPVAIHDFEGSVNYVKAYGNFIFVASGTGGLNILYRQ